jgi:uncharacterized membrane protein YgcG
MLHSRATRSCSKAYKSLIARVFIPFGFSGKIFNTFLLVFSQTNVKYDDRTKGLNMKYTLILLIICLLPVSLQAALWTESMVLSQQAQQGRTVSTPVQYSAYAPTTVVYAPAPVVYAPAPVYYAPAPIYYEPYPYYYPAVSVGFYGGWHGGHYYGHGGGYHGGGGHGGGHRGGHR